MTATLKLINLQNPSSATANIVLNADGSTTIPTQSTTNLAYTGTLTGGTGVIAIGTNQIYKDASGNVGIGTSLPGAKLQVNSEIQVVSGSNIGRFLTDGSNFYVGTRSAIPMRFETNSTTQAILDTSGNLGLGVTPSAWASGKAFEINIAGNAVWSGPGYLNLMQNVVYASAAYRYGANGTACRYEQTAGQHLWLTAPSGTAGNAISFTQAMTLDASGNLSVGTTSNSAKLNIDALTAALAGDFNSTNASGVYLRFRNGGTAIGDVGAAASIVGGSASDFGLNVRSGSLILGTSNTERARINSSGNLLVGIATDSGGSRLRVRSAGNTFSTNCIVIENSSGSNLGYIRDDGAWNTGTAAGSPYNLTTGSAANAFLDSTGFLYRSTSSLKYKTDVQDANHGLTEVMQLRPVTYKGKNDGDTVFGGLIAEEVHEAGLTEFVQYAEDGSPDALAYGNMVSLLVKAIQELKAELDAYKASHP